MSLAGIRSNRGDAYQRAVAMFYVVKMLLDDDIRGVQVDSVAIPDSDNLIYGDDIVVLRNDGKNIFIQAKVNQTEHKAWSLSDSILKKELISAHKQLLSDELCEFHFISRTPFGDFQRLIEEIRLYPNYTAFQNVSAEKHKKSLNSITSLWELDDGLYTFELCQRIKIGSHHSVDEWIAYCGELLKPNFSRSQTALELLWSYVDKQHSKLGAPQYVIDRTAILGMLEQHAIHHALHFDEKSLLDKFRLFSMQGRQWVRTIGEEVLPRSELDRLKIAVNTKVSSVLLEDVAGGGKTCLLLDFLDYLDTQEDIATLFFKGDFFSSIKSLNDLSQYGLPNDFVSQCAHLAEHRQIVIVIDSLDVLAVGRSHQALKSFLGLIAVLSVIPNITVVAASRSFDAKYDPMLREAEWSERIIIEPLSYNDEISPLLVKWGVNPECVSQELQKLILVPQNLRLFYSLVKKGLEVSEIEGHDLYDSYIREIIEQDVLLGADVVTALQNTATGLLDRREYLFPKNTLVLEDVKIQRLLSYQILTEYDAFQLMFSHQTLADALRIRQAQKNGVSLLEFVITQPQLPFVRPAIRAYIQSLRLMQPKMFIRQIRQLFQSEKVATHIKRLAIETIAEMRPIDGDISVLRLLATQSPTLFMRFLNRAEAVEWFLLLHEHWLPEFNEDEQGVTLGYFLNYSARFRDEYPDTLVALWHQALDELWQPIQSLVWSITSNLRNFNYCNVNDVDRLLERLFEASENERDGIGSAISRYVEQNNLGDGLLWRYIVKDAPRIGEIRRGSEFKLRCKPNDFHSKEFLENRLKNSDELFRLALEYLEQFGNSSMLLEGKSFVSTILGETSWRKKHHQRDRPHVESSHVFLNAIEASMKYRSSINDGIWKQYEQRIRNNCELGLRYLLCQSYKCNIQDNIDGISFQLTDRNLLRSTDMKYAIGVLSLEAYPYLSADIQEIHQLMLLGLYDDEDDIEYKIYNDKQIYEYFTWIPAPYKLNEITSFFERAEKQFGSYRPEPHISSSSGVVSSPVSEEEMIELDSNSLIRIFHHYDNYKDMDNWFNGFTGGRDSIESALSTATSWRPDQFIPLIPVIERYGFNNGYVFSIIRGVATHLSARFTNCQNASWKAMEPLPSGDDLALQLLSLVEKYGRDKEYEHTIIRAVESCCHILKDESSLERLIFQLWFLSLSKNPDPTTDEEAQSLIGHGINSVRGVAAECVLVLCNSLLEQGIELTVNLRQLLERFAKDPTIAVRATYLRRFPYFLSRESEFGWQLIALLVRDKKPRLWKHLEQTLYYQYSLNFELVSPYLDSLRQTEDDKSAAAWGRLATLSYLSDHVSEENLFRDLIVFQSKGALKGAADVFVQNLNNAKSRNICVEGLLRLMNLDAPTSVYSKFEYALNESDNIKIIPPSLINVFILRGHDENFRDIYGLFDWIANRVLSDAENMLQYLEKLVTRLSAVDFSHYFHKPESLIIIIKLLLQEADISDDEAFIERVLCIQDWFLEQGVEGLEGLLEGY